MRDFLPRKKLFKFKTKIIKTEYINDNTKNITISVPENFDFYPGQFISLIFFINGQEFRRPYSIASKPQKEKIELCIKILPNGKTTPIIGNMKAGDEIEAMGPMGAFYILEECMKNNIVFISTGTGIAPFRAMINSLLENNYKNKLKLISGYRYKKDVLYEEEFKNLEKKYENFNYYRILSKEGEEKGRGYVQKLISENLELDTYYYICGLKEMVNSVKDFLIEKGIEKEKIVIEKYD